jgi:hypothetical protein
MSDAVFTRCCQAYARECGQYPGMPQQPSAASSDWEHQDRIVLQRNKEGELQSVGVYVLRNVRGVLARYRVVGDEVDGFSVRRIPNGD